MRKAKLAVATAAGFAAILIVEMAMAEPYRWCATYGARGARNCGFVTLEQCRATVSGIGGSCSENLFYTGPEQTVRPKRKRPRD